MLDFSVTLVITILNIAILTLILRKILFKPVTKFMDDRTRKIQDDIDQAERDRNQAKLLVESYEERLRNAETEADGIVRAAREAAKRDADAIISAGREEAQSLIVNARRQIEGEQRTAMALFQAEAAALVVAASGRLIRRELSPDDSRRQAALILQELGKGA
jgi:F-type H+-transporting ATPase subunit b